MSDYQKGDKVRVFGRKSGQQLHDAVVVCVKGDWFGLRAQPMEEKTECGDVYSVNMNQDAFELLPINSPIFRYEKREPAE